MCVVLKSFEEMKVIAGDRFVAKMANPAFVAEMLQEVGVSQSPCFCCLGHIQKTCKIIVRDKICGDYKLYSRSPEKVERKFLARVKELRANSFPQG
jgi:hypothetical protein